MSDKLLIRGGTVLTMDPAIGDLPRADVLIDGDTITAVRPDISADAETIDADGFIVIPGFVDTHRHTWEAAIRGSAPDATLDDYFVEILDTFAPLYRPEDVYAANLAGALECLNAGITTLVDWSHINNTPEHPDAAIPRSRRSASDPSTRTAVPTPHSRTTGTRARSPSRRRTCGACARPTSPATTAC